MASFNKVILLGNLTRDVHVKNVGRDMVVAEFGMAVNRRYKAGDGDDREEVTFIDCTAFGRQAEVLSQYVGKGSPLFIEGRLKYDQWEDRETGAKRSKLSVVVEGFQFLVGKEGDRAAGNGRNGGGGGERRGDRRGSGVGSRRADDDDDLPI